MNSCNRLLLAAWGLAVALFAGAVGGAESTKGPFLATGVKVGEVSDRSAIVWIRLTRRPRANSVDGPNVRVEYVPTPGKPGKREQTVQAVRFDGGVTVGDLREAAPGVDGDVRVLCRSDGQADWKQTPWTPVDPLRDFTRQIELEGLKADSKQQFRVETRGVDGTPGASLDGTFRTAPAADKQERILFSVVTCFGNDDQDAPDGFKLYRSIARLEPHFFVHTGDILYYDQLAKTVELARWHWQRMYGRPTNVEFHRSFASYFMKDDHDAWRNDCWPTMKTPYMHEFTFRQGLALFREQVPMGRLTYRTARWGKDLQIWLVEGRDYRSPNNAPDGPGKTIWGVEQKRWLFDSVAASNATFRVLISPTPIVGPDRSQKADNHANAGFRHEGNEIRRFLASQKNMVVFCGDRHWQYASVDPETQAREYGCGPASDKHAGGWKQEDYRKDFHRFLRVAGGFLTAEVDRPEGKPTLTIRLHDVDGAVKYEDRRTAQ